jgi:hypothetical protein
MNTDYGLSTFWSGSTIVRDERGVFSVWKNSYNSKSRIARLDLTLFAKEGDSHRRMDEVHLEKAYSLDEIKDCMKRAGLEEAGLYHHLTFSRPTRTSKRIMIVARKRGG